MGNASFWMVEGPLSLPLAVLVWGTQHLLNSLHPSASYRWQYPSALPVLVRVGLLLVLWVLTCLMATCLFLVASMSAPGWQKTWSFSTLWLAFGAGCVMAMALVFGCASLGHLCWLQRQARLNRDNTFWMEKENRP